MLGKKAPQEILAFSAYRTQIKGGEGTENMTGTRGHGASTISCTSLKSYFKVLIWPSKDLAGGPLNSIFIC